MKQDDTSKELADPTAFLHQRAMVLRARVDAATEALHSLRTTLSEIALHGCEEPDDTGQGDREDSYTSWTSLDASVAGLESVVSRIAQQGERLKEIFLGDRSGAMTEDAPRAGGPANDLEALIRVQRAALLALNEQISDAEYALNRPRLRESKPAQRYGAVEIQDVAEFLRDSPIASIPVNASYYQRILEAAHSPEGHKRPMGAILVEAELITERQLDNALAHQKEGRKRPLGALLVDLGYTTDAAIAQTIAAQLALPFVTLSQEPVHPDALETIPLHLARRHTIFPVSLNDGALYVAMANPLDLIALEDLRLASGKHVRPCVASREEINGHIDRHYAGSVF